ncbi:sporulation protein YunB [Alkalicella caledoniensis]|uniref:Sporulation protein YunB n=1 Tax=Alkalicella caledoniensis TaxID=2731377 RepID=A0A7G9WAK0_ALKCA|nr:sporulation protein YunB [Alkalicella caledoniensis]QNO15712.1 sporulation protein YunB [Alkalicella caledoniensis]
MFRKRRFSLFRGVRIKKFRLIGFLIMILFIYSSVRTFIFIETNLRPTIISIAEARAKVIATEAINNAIDLHIARESRYEHLIFVQKDYQGNIAMAEVNNMEIARIQTLTIMNVQDTLKRIKSEKIRIPLGQALGSEILANYGPKIPVTLVPIGTVQAGITQKFNPAGINIVSHEVGIDIEAEVQIIIPFVSSAVTVTTYTPIVTATYFGKVPDTVINLPLGQNFEIPSVIEGLE